MRKIQLFMPIEKDQDVICERWKHLLKKIDREFCEVRTYVVGVDLSKSDLHPKWQEETLPFCVETKPNQQPKKRSFESMWKTYILEQDKAEDEYIPDYD